MTLADLLDVAYVLMVERLERIALAAMSAGADVDVQDVLAEFDADLHRTSEGVSADLSPEQVLLRRSLGVL